MSVHTISIDLNAKEARALQAAYPSNDLNQALEAAVVEGIKIATLRAKYPRPHVPNAETSRALRTAPSKRDSVFSTAAEARARLRRLLKR